MIGVKGCMCVHAQSVRGVSDCFDPIDCSPPSSSVHGILQARIQEWVAMPSSRGSSNPGINPTSLKSPALAGEFFTNSATWYKVHTDFTVILGFKVRTREHLTQPP